MLPFPPADLSGHAKGQWRGKHSVTQKWRDRARIEATGLDAKFPPDGKPYTEAGDIGVRITFVPPDRRSDRVNFPNRMKPIFDGIADALGVNDSRFVPEYVFAEPEKPGCVIVEIVS